MRDAVAYDGCAEFIVNGTLNSAIRVLWTKEGSFRWDLVWAPLSETAERMATTVVMQGDSVSLVQTDGGRETIPSNATAAAVLGPRIEGDLAAECLLGFVGIPGTSFRPNEWHGTGDAIAENVGDVACFRFVIQHNNSRTSTMTVWVGQNDHVVRKVIRSDTMSDGSVYEELVLIYPRLNDAASRRDFVAHPETLGGVTKDLEARREGDKKH